MSKNGIVYGVARANCDYTIQQQFSDFIGLVCDCCYTGVQITEMMILQNNYDSDTYFKERISIKRILKP